MSRCTKTRATGIHAHTKAAMLVAVTFVAAGCVSQRYVDDLNMLYRRSQEQVLDLRAQLEEKETEIDVIRAAMSNQDPTLSEKLQKAVSGHDRLSKALAEAESRLRSIGSETALDPAMDAALVNLSKSNPQLMTYDSEMGMVQFQSDLTFNLGSTDVNKQALQSLDKLAQLLKSPTGNQYRVRIEGHTDNVPIGRPATRAQHPTNWHLSVHRAIAVKDALVHAGVNAKRMGVAGFGEHRPVAPNGPKGNKANRRVEIYLVRESTRAALSAPPAGNEQPQNTTATRQPIATPKPKSNQAPPAVGAYK